MKESIRDAIDGYKAGFAGEPMGIVSAAFDFGWEIGDKERATSKQEAATPAIPTLQECGIKYAEKAGYRTDEANFHRVFYAYCAGFTDGTKAAIPSDVPRLHDFIRREVERAIDEAVNPKGMSVHDGKARIGSDKLAYMLKLIDNLYARAALKAAQPVPINVAAQEQVYSEAPAEGQRAYSPVAVAPDAPSDVVAVHSQHCDEHAECDDLRERMAALLTGVANALRGDPGPLRRWSWHDLPVRAAVMREQRDSAQADFKLLAEAFADAYQPRTALDATPAPQEPAPMTREWCAAYPGAAAGIINRLARQVDATWPVATGYAEGKVHMAPSVAPQEPAKPVAWIGQYEWSVLTEKKQGAMVYPDQTMPEPHCRPLYTQSVAHAPKEPAEPVAWVPLTEDQLDELYNTHGYKGDVEEFVQVVSSMLKENNAAQSVADAQDAMRWIPVTERLPERGVLVPLLLAREHYNTSFGFITDDGTWESACVEHECFELRQVTHWMPLPDAPAMVPDVTKRDPKGKE
jgi:hypothetical protein